MQGFQNIDVVDFCGCESPEKSIPLFILYLFLCLFQILAVDQSINTFTQLVILLWRPREKLKHPKPEQEQQCFHQLPFMERTQPWGAWQHAGSEQGRYNLHTAVQAPANQSHAKKSAASQSSRTPSRVANTYILN